MDCHVPLEYETSSAFIASRTHAPYTVIVVDHDKEARGRLPARRISLLRRTGGPYKVK